MVMLRAVNQIRLTLGKEDLNNFHAAHFNSRQQDHEKTQDYEAESDLGFYADGTPRTLTDEQIAIFRHSEIQALLLQRRKAAEEAKGSDVSQPIQGDLSDGEIDPNGHTAPLAALENSNPGHGSLPDHDEDDDAEYARFLEQEQQEFARATRRKRQKRNPKYDKADRTISTRRRIREMDAYHDSAQTLSYDDDAPIQNNRDTQATAQIQAEQSRTHEGRKIWWPQIGAGPEKDLFVDS
jgi:Protein of unknown function (DUF3807)